VLARPSWSCQAVGVAANTGPAASERSAKAAIMVFIFDVHRLTGKPNARAELAVSVMGNNELLSAGKS
jgi:hypothetical protein